jgi:cation diffusion facilitator family transporter
MLLLGSMVRSEAMPCCECESADRAALRSAAQRRVLWAVLAINLGIFVGEFGAGLWADSTALQGDALDGLGDALVYGLSLLVAGRSLRARAAAAAVKGGIQVAFGALVLLEVARQLLLGAQPLPQVMAVAAGVALLANAACLILLTRFRGDDVNMRSVWLCSRNDVVGNAGVLLTAALVGATGWRWLDPLFGAALAVLFLRTGVQVLRQAWPQLRR